MNRKDNKPKNTYLFTSPWPREKKDFKGRKTKNINFILDSTYHDQTHDLSLITSIYFPSYSLHYLIKSTLMHFLSQNLRHILDSSSWCHSHYITKCPLDYLLISPQVHFFLSDYCNSLLQWFNCLWFLPIPIYFPIT